MLVAAARLAVHVAAAQLAGSSCTSALAVLGAWEGRLRGGRSQLTASGWYSLNMGVED